MKIRCGSNAVIFLVASFWYGCTSRPTPICIQDRDGIINVKSCGERRIKSLLLYHLDSASNRFLTDWELAPKNADSLSDSVTLLRANQNYTELHTIGQVPDGVYLLTISTSYGGGVAQLTFKHGELVSVHHDSTTPCLDCVPALGGADVVGSVLRSGPHYPSSDPANAPSNSAGRLSIMP